MNFFRHNRTQRLAERYMALKSDDEAIQAEMRSYFMAAVGPEMAQRIRSFIKA